MVTQILNNCSFDSAKIDKLYLGYNANYPIEYNTITPNNSKILVSGFNGNQAIIGGQTISFIEIYNNGDIVFTEDQIIDNNGLTYKKNLTFSVDKNNLFVVNQIKKYLFTKNNKYGLTPIVVLLIDENDQNLIVGYDKPMYCESLEFVIGTDNKATIQMSSISKTRSKTF